MGREGKGVLEKKQHLCQIPKEPRQVVKVGVLVIPACGTLVEQFEQLRYGPIRRGERRHDGPGERDEAGDGRVLGEVGQEHADGVRVRFVGVLWIGYHWISLCAVLRSIRGGYCVRAERVCVCIAGNEWIYGRMDIPLLVRAAFR